MADFGIQKDTAKESHLSNFGRITKGFLEFDRQNTTRNSGPNQYAIQKDPKLDQWLNTQVERGQRVTTDLGNQHNDFEKLGHRTASNCMKFSYETSLDKRQSEFQKDRKQFYLDLQRNRKYKISDLRDIL